MKEKEPLSPALAAVHRKKKESHWPWRLIRGGSTFLLFALILVLIARAVMQRNQRIKSEGELRMAARLSRTIATTIEFFDWKYHRLPHPPKADLSSGDLTTDTSPQQALIPILLGKEETLSLSEKQNPEAHDCLIGIKPAKPNPKPAPSSPERIGNWLNGLIIDEHSPDGSLRSAIVDPWGNYFRIRLDTDGNKEIANPDPDEVADGRLILPKRVIVWSPGKDGHEETWSDNPKSWD